MRILLAHNFYRSSAPSGEDAVYHNEVNLLRERGTDVITFERYNDDLDDSNLRNRIGIALSGAWSGDSYRKLRKLIDRSRPDIAHFHNTFPQISPSAYAACQDSGVPVVQTLHNYRLICPGALLQRDGKPCELCVGHNLLPALQHRCYRDSLTATGALVWMLSYNRIRGSYQKLVDRYIALTRFAADRLVAGGLPADRIAIKPNFLPDEPVTGTGRGGYVIYVGRLSEEKGLRTLLRAWRSLPEVPLRIVGEGPLGDELQQQAEADGLNIEFLGQQPRERILDLVGAASLQVVPSEWYEGFPMVLLEAMSCGTPVLASNIGSLGEIVVPGITGYHFEPKNDVQLAERVRAHMATADHAPMRDAVIEHYKASYSIDRNHASLMSIYEEAARQHNESRSV